MRGRGRNRSLSDDDSHGEDEESHNMGSESLKSRTRERDGTHIKYEEIEDSDEDEEEEYAEEEEDSSTEEEDKDEVHESIFTTKIEIYPRIEKIFCSRETTKGTIEYLVSMHGCQTPFLYWADTKRLSRFANFGTCLKRFNDAEGQPKFYTSQVEYSTRWDGPLQCIGRKKVCDCIEYLFQIDTVFGIQFYWEDKNEFTPNAKLIDHYEKHLITVKSQRPRRPERMALSEADIEKYKSKNGFKIKSYQLTGINWLLNCFCKNHGCILADEMGLGKTIQTIVFLNYLVKVAGWKGPHLIVVRSNTFVQWCNELSEWSDLEFLPYTGSPTEREVIRRFKLYADTAEGKKDPNSYRVNIMVVNYEILYKDSSYFKDVAFQCEFIDEGHRIKRQHGQQHIAFESLKSLHRVILTGTPVQSTLSELYSLLNFVSPMHFRDPDLFPDDDIDSLDPVQTARIRMLIAPHLMRRTLMDVEKSIIPKDERYIFLKLTQPQKMLTRLIKMHELWRIHQKTDKDVGTESNMLHKCCNHPFMVEGAEEYLTNGRNRSEVLINCCAKFQFLDQILPRFKKEKRSVLIFSQRIHIIDLLSEYCMVRRYTFKRLDGTLKGSEKKEAINTFLESDDVFIFLISTKSGAEGLNLTKATITIIFDPDWNPNNDLQALGRCHRIGQTKKVLVLRLITYGTYEHQMYLRAQKKLELWSAVLGDGTVSDLESNDIRIGGLLTRQHNIRFSPSLDLSLAKQKDDEIQVPEPPDIMHMKPDSSKDIEEILNDTSTVLTDISNCGVPPEIDLTDGVSDEEFLKQFPVEGIAASIKKKKCRKRANGPISLQKAKLILMALEKFGYGQWDEIIEYIGKESTDEDSIKIDHLMKFCQEAVVIHTRAIDTNAFTMFPFTVALCRKEPKEIPLANFSCKDGEEWLGPYTKPSHPVSVLAPLRSNIRQTAFQFMNSLEMRFICREWESLQLELDYSKLPPARLDAVASDDALLGGLLAGEPDPGEGVRLMQICAQMRRQLIESDSTFSCLQTPLWGKREIKQVFSVIRNYGKTVTEMRKTEIAGHSGLFSKSHTAISTLANKIINSMKTAEAQGRHFVKIPANATSSSLVTSEFSDPFVLDAGDMETTLMRIRLSMTFPKAVDNLEQDVERLDTLITGDSRGWFTRRHLLNLIKDMREFGMDVVTLTLLGRAEFRDNLDPNDIKALEACSEIRSDTKIPPFVMEEEKFLELVLKECDFPDDLAMEIRPKRRFKRLAEEKSEDEKHTKKGLKHTMRAMRMSMPRHVHFRFHFGKPKETLKEVEDIKQQWRRSFDADSRRIYAQLLAGKPCPEVDNVW